MDTNCIYCGGALYSDTRIEFLGNPDEAETEVSASFQEQRQCRQCGQWTGIRSGTGYWSRESWEYNQDADRLVYDD